MKGPVSQLRDSSGRGRSRDASRVTQIIAQTSQFLTTRPPAAHICQFLVLHLTWPATARSAALARCTQDGGLVLEGTFGVTKDLAVSYHRMPLFEGTPMADSVISHGPIIIPDTGELSARYPTVSDDLRTDPGYSPASSLIAVPLMSYAGPAGSMGIFFENAREHLDDLVPLIEAIGSVVALRLDDESDSQRLHPSSVVRTLGTSPATSGTDPTSSPLTNRQMEVLRLMAQRMPNHDIAVAMGYSESTIRMEATAIYRALGVPGRHEAVSTARHHGLIA